MPRIIPASGGSGAATIPQSALRPTGSLYETLPRGSGIGLANAAVLVSQRLQLVAIELPSGLLITSISFVSGTTAGATLVNQLFGIYDDEAGTSSGTARALLRGTVDDGAAAWAASAVKTLALTSTYTTVRAGLHYLGILVNATTVPSLNTAGALQGAINIILPKISGTSTTAVTALPNPAGAITVTQTAFYGYVN